MTSYPEHEKLHKVKEFSQAIGEFMEWLQYDKEYTLRSWQDSLYYPASLDIQKLLAEYYNIDLDRLEAEKRQILEEHRKAKEKGESD